MRERIVNFIKFLALCLVVSIPLAYIFVKYHLNIVLTPVDFLLTFFGAFILSAFFIQEGFLSVKVFLLILISMFFALTISAFVILFPFMLLANDSSTSMLIKTLQFSTYSIVRPRFIVYFILLFLPLSLVSIFIGMFLRSRFIKYS